jgi:AcrR family transcriptional regulator
LVDEPIHEIFFLSNGALMARSYQLKKRAEDRDKTRERILTATMQLHDEQGVAPTTFVQIAERAGVGAATVYRHFPKLGDLVMACGAHVWQEMRPPVPDTAPEVFAGLDAPRARLSRLVDELDAFYGRGALRLTLAARDRELVPELDGFLHAVEGCVEALVREALRPARPPEGVVQVVLALMQFPVWAAFNRLGVPRAVRLGLLECGMAAAQ